MYLKRNTGTSQTANLSTQYIHSMKKYIKPLYRTQTIEKLCIAKYLIKYITLNQDQEAKISIVQGKTYKTSIKPK